MPIRASTTFAGGQILEAAECNDGWSGLLDDLAGRNGAVEREDSFIILRGNGSRYFGLPSGTTGQRTGSPQPGYLRFNITLDHAEYWNGATWRNLINDVSVVIYANLNANGYVGAGANMVSRGNHQH